MDADLEKLRHYAVGLAQAVSAGNKAEAARLAGLLALANAPLDIRPQASAYPAPEIRIQVRFEDSEKTAGPITMAVHSHWTVAHLKNEIFKKYTFHPMLQRWVFGGRLAKDHHSLHLYGIRRDGDHAFLYLLKVPQSPGDAGERPAAVTGNQMPVGERLRVSRMSLQDIMAVITDQLGISVELDPLLSNPPAVAADTAAEWACSMCTLLNRHGATRCSMCETPREHQIAAEQGRPGSYMENFLCDTSLSNLDADFLDAVFYKS